MSDRRQELIEKVTRLVETRFGGDWSHAFEHYSTGGDRISVVGVVHLLEDSGVGSDWTRHAWGRAVAKAIDADEDGLISWQEFKTCIEDRR